jgi:hypothetical protein
VCVYQSDGDCSSILALDSRSIVCASPPCIVVEITQNTAQWLTTKASLEPGVGQLVQSIPTPTLKARAIVSLRVSTQTVTKSGTDCILALANDPQAVLVHGGSNADLTADCGVAIDGGLDQNPGTPIQGGITFNGSKSKVNILGLVVAAKSANCPDGGVHCQQYGSTAALTNVITGMPTQDPYAAEVAHMFQAGGVGVAPLGVQTGGVAVKSPGSGYTNGTCTFTVSGGTYYGTTSTPATFTAIINKNGTVGSIGSITDPGAYSVFPTSPVSATSTCGGSGATFSLTEGCFTWNSTAIAGRKYCSISVSGSLKFPAGNYYIAGGDNSCKGFCIPGNGSVISDVAGVTFFLTSGEGTGTYGTGSYATVSITGNPTLNLCAPGTNCGKNCTNNAGPASCMLFVQNPAATQSTSLGQPSGTGGNLSPNTVNSFNGTQNSTLSGLIYLPNQTYQNQGTAKIGGCVGVIAKYFDIGGTPSFSDGCLPGNGIGGTTTTVTNYSNPALYQ